MYRVEDGVFIWAAKQELNMWRGVSFTAIRCESIYGLWRNYLVTALY